MNKEEYQKELEIIRNQRKALDEKTDALKESYIEANKPCQIGDQVVITLVSGRVVKGEALKFGILSDRNVHITAFKEATQKGGTSTKYITAPTLGVKVISHG